MLHHLNWWLIAAGTLSGLASAVHLGCIWRGAAWYRFLGAGDRMVRQVEHGAIRQTIITAFIAFVLAIWAIYAFSGAGLIAPLPLLYPILIAVTVVYLARGLALPFLFRALPDRTPLFLVLSSAIVFAIGLIHLAGLYVHFHAEAGGAHP